MPRRDEDIISDTESPRGRSASRRPAASSSVRCRLRQKTHEEVQARYTDTDKDSMDDDAIRSCYLCRDCIIGDGKRYLSM